MQNLRYPFARDLSWWCWIWQQNRERETGRGLMAKLTRPVIDGGERSCAWQRAWPSFSKTDDRHGNASGDYYMVGAISVTWPRR